VQTCQPYALQVVARLTERSYVKSSTCRGLPHSAGAPNRVRFPLALRSDHFRLQTTAHSAMPARLDGSFYQSAAFLHQGARRFGPVPR
jgi:hypothetical protein